MDILEIYVGASLRRRDSHSYMAASFEKLETSRLKLDPDNLLLELERAAEEAGGNADETELGIFC
jgi:hypothetical protein